jgi:hypothetical protein
MHVGAGEGRKIDRPAVTERGDSSVKALDPIRSPTHKLDPDSGCCQLDEGEVVFAVFLVSRGDGAVVFDFAEEPLDCVAQFIELGAEGGFVDPLWSH